MKDISIFQGWKELAGPDGNIRLEDKGDFWGIYKYVGNSYVFAGHIDKKPRESNKALYERAIAEAE